MNDLPKNAAISLLLLSEDNNLERVMSFTASEKTELCLKVKKETLMLIEIN